MAPEDETLSVLLDLAHAERQLRLESLDALDGKAGVLIGFAGVFVGLSATLPNWWLRLAIILPALISACFAFDAYRVKTIPAFKPQETRDKYLSKPPRVVRQTVLDTMTSNQVKIEAKVAKKARRVTISLWLLGLSILIMAGIVLFTGGPNV